MEGRRTGILYDPRMLKHKSLKHNLERPKRLEYIMERLKEVGLLDREEVEYLGELEREVID